ncbi:unnamed protein product, partial [marine sediment metagenome]
MGSTRVTRTYGRSEFTIAGNNPNAKIFAMELAELSLTAQPSTVYNSGTNVVLEWVNVLPVAADITAIDT